MKNKILTILISFLSAFVLCACANKVDYDALKENTGLMFVATEYNTGENDITSDYWVSTKFNIFYDGSIEVIETYNVSGDIGIRVSVSDKEYKKIYDFISKGKIDRSVDGVDGAQWDFYSYDLEGKPTLIYQGYIYGIKEIESIQEILKNYIFVEEKS
ncbi:MAG: hypothetical protein KBT48_05975 [Firmicutes bacterium]|nr:hypothetical protein [Bacillota bacterium]